MTVEEAVVSTILANGTVNAITTRLHPQMLPQEPTYPAIVYSVISNMPDQTLQGPSGLAYARFRFDIIAETNGGAKALAAALKTALDGKSFTVSTYELRSIVALGDTDLYEDEIECHCVSSDFGVWHSA